MSTIYDSNYTKIEDISQLLQKYQQSCSAKSQIGLEVEKLALQKNYQPLAYSHASEPCVKAILEILQREIKAEAIVEHGNIVALEGPTGMISLEPGGQVEYGVSPSANLGELEEKLSVFLKMLEKISQTLNITWWNIGFQPLLRLDEMHWMPKARYEIMKAYLPKQASLPLEMMGQSASLQATFDYSSEEEMAFNFRLSQALNPILVALYANSPFKEGQFTGYHSYRTHVWDHVDPRRCGFLPKAMEEGFTFLDYVNCLLDMPMMFLYRDDQWISVDQITFRDFWQKGYQGLTATMGDWELHCSSLFTEVRLRPWMEIRTADLPPDDLILTYPAFLKGLLYHRESAEYAWERLKQPSLDQVLSAREESALKGLEGQYLGEPLKAVALDLIYLSRRGLKKQGHPEEVAYLEPLMEGAKTGKSPSHHLMDHCSCEGQFDLSSHCFKILESKISH